jgi:acyl-homoserine-lactone acylase
LAPFVGAALVFGGVATAQTPFEAKITRTTHNIAHIEAETWQGVGYGVAYAYAQDNFCMLAEEFVSVKGERSFHFGPEGRALIGTSATDNLTSDVFHLGLLDIERLRADAEGQSAETAALIEGFVAGYNRYLFDHPRGQLPAACDEAEWVRPITTDDMLRLNERTMLLASSLALAEGIVAAAPPGTASARSDEGELPDALSPDGPRLGSNGWAFGGDATNNGRGLVIGNPHFPWEGPARFWQMHVRGPDGYDVMGVGIAGTPIPTLGFNKDVAWTHTVTAARHFTLHALQLVPGDPTSYMLDGEPVEMTETIVTVPMPDGEGAIERVLYSSEFGPIVTVPGTGIQWTGAMAFAINDANLGNIRAMDAWLGIGRARNVAEIEAAVSETLGIPWVNTIAADRDGNALHADITTIPNVSAEFASACATPISGLVANMVTLLDGTRSQCNWKAQPTAADHAGLLPASEQASRTRRDYVTNSNDSYWLSHAGEPYVQLSPILGAWKTELSLRTRSNFTETEAMLSAGPVNHERAQALVFGNKAQAAEMALDALLAGPCATSNSAAEPCAVLRGWDRRYDNASRGAYLFLAFWDKVRGRSDLWQMPFDPENPVATPAGLQVEGEAGAALMAALAEAAEEIEARGIAVDAPWGEVQVRLSDGDRIAVHGGPHQLGILNMQRSREIEGGLTPVHGSSYVQIVGFDEDGPVADAVLSYSQSTDPNSPFYADQTLLYSDKEWVRLPFSDPEIEAGRIGETLTISE